MNASKRTWVGRNPLSRLIPGAVCVLLVGCTGNLARQDDEEREQRVVARNCVEVVDERGRKIRLGPDCAIGPSVLPAPVGPSAGEGAEREAPEQPEESPRGCPLEFFETASQPGSVRFAFPIWDANTILLEPGVIHKDRSPDPEPEGINCLPFAPGHFCYASHTGTDFMLGGIWWAMDEGVTVRAAAAGVVSEVVDGNFDRCHADLTPWSPTFGRITCPDPESDSSVAENSAANMISICHADGTVSRYAHLVNGSAQVQVGDEVACGDPLGLVGSSGISAAPHLHFDLTVSGEDGARPFVDPYSADPAQSRWVDQRDGALGSLPATTCQR